MKNKIALHKNNFNTSELPGENRQLSLNKRYIELIYKNIKGNTMNLIHSKLICS